MKEYYGSLRKHKKIGNIIEADYYYNSDGPRGHFKYDMTTGKFIELKRIREFESGFVHVKHALEMMIKNDKYPETYEVFWY